MFRRGIQILKYSRLLQQEIARDWPIRAFASRVNTEGTPESAEKKKKKFVEKITLITDGNNIEVTSLEEAKKLSTRRNLKLVKMVDVDFKTQRPVYKLLSGADFYEQEKKQRETQKEKSKNEYIKGEKMLQMSGKIGAMDITSKAKLVSKWVAKSYQIRVVIMKDGVDNVKLDQITKEIENASPECRILEKRVSNSDMRFTILPPKRSISSTDDTPPKDVNQQVRSYHTNSSS